MLGREPHGQAAVVVREGLGQQARRHGIERLCVAGGVDYKVGRLLLKLGTSPAHMMSCALPKEALW